jgi:class 3 adenylate cyclase/cold shock CspA family protein
MNEHKQQLRDAFASPESRTERTIVVVDVNGSTAMKETQPQAAWLPTIGWWYDIVTELAHATVPSVVIKYLGDGIMLVFDVDQATDAVNAAMQIQEAIRDAGRGTGGAMGMVKVTCSVGISSGEVIGFTTPAGGLDFVGAQVDKAFRLCSAANENAIFVDTQTLGAANVTRFNSRVGAALGWASDQYLGDPQKVTLKGFGQPVAYHEIKWDHQLYGVASSEVTASTDRLRPVSSGRTPAADAASSSAPRTVERHSGEVTCWRPDKGFGFIRDTHSGESFWFCPRRLVYPDSAENLALGMDVAFVAVGTADGKRSREAGAILVVGEQADGPLVSLPADRPYGWVRVEDDEGNHHLVYVPVREMSGCKVGDILGFMVGATDKGAFAEQVEPIVGDEAA